MSEELVELEQRLERARRLGGPEGIARQHGRGKLTVLERIELLADPGSFREFAVLMGTSTYDDSGELTAFTPKSQISGECRVDGRKVIVTGGDFTVRGGSSDGGGGLGTEYKANERALNWRLPMVRLLDAAGGSVRGFDRLGRTYLPDGNIWSQVDVELLNQVPVVSAVLGSVAGLPAVNACLAHWNVMVKNTAQLFPGGPPVVKAALGQDITKEELGGAQIHVGQSGVVDNLAEDEADAIAQARRFLSYLPSNVDELAPRAESTDLAERREEALATLVPDDRRRPFDAHELVTSVVDRDSFFEIAPRYGRARITGLARVDGYPVGVMANNSMFQGGATDVSAGEKVIRLLQLCDTFHLPIVTFADEPGFMVGPDSERAGIERAGARLVWTTCRTRMPWLTVVVRRLYGVAGQCQHRPSGMFRRYAWPTANWGSMHITGGASAAYRREIESAPDPDAKREEIERRLQLLASPFRTAEATGQDIIDPRETRPLVVDFVHDAQRVLATQLGPSPLGYRP